MFQGWRIKLREAEDAFKHGRLDEAGQLLSDSELKQYLPGRRLTEKVAQRICERARQRVVGGDTVAGWRDLETARALGGETDELLNVRQEMIELAMNEVENYLSAGHASRALERLESLERRYVSSDQLRTWKEIARRMDSARKLSQRGKFAEAEDQLVSAAALCPTGLAILPKLQQQYREKQESSRRLTERMHRALAAEDWSEALSLAEQLLELAPENRIARDARRRAWEKVGTKVVDSRRLAETQLWAPSRASLDRLETNGHADRVSTRQLGPRFLLWIDAVGGYMVCLADTVVLGQAVPGNHVHVPFQADISRRHLQISRQGEGYVIEPLGQVCVEGRAIEGRTLLSDGDEIQFGGVCLRFRQPHALSASARLDFLTRHRTQPSCDGVLLMAESCVLGPKPQDHVVCRDWSGDVVLYRQDDQLYCRAMESIEIDGKLCDGRGQIGYSSRVSGSDFSMGLEPI